MKEKTRFFIVSFVFLLCNMFGYTQNSALKFRHIALKDGLQNLLIHSIIQDYQGFIWVGTEDGLHKYDGYGFILYYNNREDSTSLKDNNINEIIEDDSRNLWIGTNSGLELFDRHSNSFIHIPIINSQSDGVRNGRIDKYYINYLHKDKDDNIYVGTRQQVLYKVDKKGKCIRPFLNNIRFDENLVRSSDKEGNIWISSRQGAYKLNIHTRKVVHYTHNPNNPASIASNQVFFIHVDTFNNVWIATDKGLNKIDGKTRLMSCYFNNPSAVGSAPGYFIRKIYEDKFHNLWFCTEQGLFKYTPGLDNFTPYSSNANDEDGLSTNKINCVFVDRQNILWIGTETQGIDYAFLDNPYNFRIVRTNSLIDSKQENNPVTAIYKDKDDNLWIGTNGSGLCFIDGKTGAKKIYTKDPGDPSSIQTNSVLAIIQDSDGDMWFGGYYGGLNKFNRNNNSFESYSFEDKSPASIRNLTNEIKGIIEGKRNELILATNGGGIIIFNTLNKSSRFIYREASDQKSLCSNWCTTVLKDSKGFIWVGTYYGLSKWDPANNSFINYWHSETNLNSIASNIIRSITEDSGHNIWVGTSKGLCKLKNNNQFECYSRKEGFPSEVINGTLEDNEGNLWISTFQGISKFNYKTRKIKNYNANYGLSISQFVNSSYYKDRNGMLYFGSLDGFTWFNPGEVRDYEYKAPLYITEFQLLNKPVKAGDKTGLLSNPISETNTIKLKHNQSFITFKYVALNYLNPYQTQYAYILEEFDNDWHYVGSERSATYTNLSPGKYRFKIKACDENGTWNVTHQGIDLIVRPPFWQTIWAYLFYVMMLALAIYGVIKFFRFKDSIKQQVEIQRIEAKEQHKLDLLKLQFFTNISHELRTPLTLILGPSERLLNNIQNKVLPDISLADSVYRNSRRLLRLVNQLLDFRKLDSGSEKLNLKEGNIVKFVQDIFQLFRSQAGFKKIDFEINTLTDNINTCFDPDKVEKIMCNLLSNAIKFTPEGGLVTLKIEEIVSGEIKEYLNDSLDHASRYVKIGVSDTGFGIPDKEKAKVFDSFYQSDNLLLNKQEGSGIGLSIVKEYVLLHNGLIVVKDNHATQGTIFVVYLPIVENTEKHLAMTEDLNYTPGMVYLGIYDKDEIKSSLAVEQNLPEESPLILVVEDNDDMRNFIKSELSDQFRIIEASNGKEGIDKAIFKLPDLIVCDVMMGDISGIQLCKEIKTDIRTSHIPVILLTALSEDNYKIEGLETGADDFIVKPFNTGILKARIKNLVENRKQLHERFSQSVGFSNKAAATNTTDQKFLDKLFGIIEKEMDNPDIDIVSITREIGMSKTQLYKKIKAITGQSLFEFIYTIRLKKAAEILLNEDVLVSEVANRVGFSNLSVFTRSFTRQFKINPSKYASIFNSPKGQN